MNLLNLLLRTMMSKPSVNALSEKAGSSSKQTSLLLSLAIPLLLKYLTSNASSQSGASSLLGALMQHTSKKSMTAQLKDADEEDGNKIIGHILGDDSSAVINELSQQTGMSEEMVSVLLGNMAPALMSELSAAASTASASDSSTGTDNIDFTDLFNTFEPEPQVQEKPAGGLGGLGLLGALFGGLGNAADKPAENESDTIDLFGGNTGTSGSGPMIDLLSGVPQGDYNGSSLLNSLMSIMRE